MEMSGINCRYKWLMYLSFNGRWVTDQTWQTRCTNVCTVFAHGLECLQIIK